MKKTAGCEFIAMNQAKKHGVFVIFFLQTYNYEGATPFHLNSMFYT